MFQGLVWKLKEALQIASWFILVKRIKHTGCLGIMHYTKGRLMIINFSVKHHPFFFDVSESNNSPLVGYCMYVYKITQPVKTNLIPIKALADKE